MIHLISEVNKTLCGNPMDNDCNHAHWRYAELKEGEIVDICADCQRISQAFLGAMSAVTKEVCHDEASPHPGAYRDHNHNCGCSVCYAIREPLQPFHEKAN